MYRARISLWGGAFGLVIIILIMGQIVSCATELKPQVTVYCESTDNIFKTSIGNIMDEYDYVLKDSPEGADIIIKPASNETIEGYQKYEKYVYTPMVMWARRYCVDKGTGFNVVGSTYVATVYKDLGILLDAMENGKTFADIGIAKSVASGEVKLYIPSKTSQFYPCVEELFYVTLNDGKTPTDEQRSQLKERVDSLLAKCQQVEDVGQKIIDIHGTSNQDYTMFIGPECITARSSKIFNIIDAGTWVTVYPDQTVAYYYDLFIKGEETSLAYGSMFNTSSTFSRGTGYRIKGTTNLPDAYSHIVDNVTVVD